MEYMDCTCLERNLASSPRVPRLSEASILRASPWNYAQSRAFLSLYAALLSVFVDLIAPFTHAHLVDGMGLLLDASEGGGGEAPGFEAREEG